MWIAISSDEIEYWSRYDVMDMCGGRIAFNVWGKYGEIIFIRRAWGWNMDGAVLDKREVELGGIMILYVGGDGGDNLKCCWSRNDLSSFSVTKHILALPQMKWGLDMFDYY